MAGRICHAHCPPAAAAGAGLLAAAGVVLAVALVPGVVTVILSVLAVFVVLVTARVVWEVRTVPTWAPRRAVARVASPVTVPVREPLAIEAPRIVVGEVLSDRLAPLPVRLRSARG
jgi:hypothetical protein